MKDSIICSNTKLDPTVKLGYFNIIKGQVLIKKNTHIGSQCIIKGNVKIGENCILENNVELLGDITIGDNCHLHSGVKIGGKPQHRGEKELKNSKIVIGNENTFRENVTVNMPYHKKTTLIGNNNYIMVNVNIPHDGVIGNYTTICNNVSLGGNVYIGDYANIGLNAVIHQSIKIGAHSMIGMGAVIAKNVLPFSMIINDRSSRVSINIVGYNRNYTGNISMKGILNLLRSQSVEEIQLIEDKNILNEIKAMGEINSNNFYNLNKIKPESS